MDLDAVRAKEKEELEAKFEEGPVSVAEKLAAYSKRFGPSQVEGFRIHLRVKVALRLSKVQQEERRHGMSKGTSF